MAPTHAPLHGPPPLQGRGDDGTRRAAQGPVGKNDGGGARAEDDDEGKNKKQQKIMVGVSAVQTVHCFRDPLSVSVTEL